MTENQLGIKGRRSGTSIGTSGDLTKFFARRFSCRSVAEAFGTHDAGAVLDLQSLVNTVYAASRYDRTTHYRESPEPPLEGADAVWVDSLLKAAGRR